MEWIWGKVRVDSVKLWNFLDKCESLGLTKKALLHMFSCLVISDVPSLLVPEDFIPYVQNP